MLIVFLPLFGDTKIIFGYSFGAPLKFYGVFDVFSQSYKVMKF